MNINLLKDPQNNWKYIWKYISVGILISWMLIFAGLVSSKVLIIGGMIIPFGIIIFYWILVFEKRKEEIVKKENWNEFKQEIKSKKWFYICTILIIISFLSYYLLITSLLRVYGSNFWHYFLQYKPLISLIFWIGSISAVAVFFSVPGLIRETWKNKTKIVCWENYAASFCLAIFWLNFVFIFTIFFSGGIIMIPVFIFFTTAIVSGIGFSVGSLIHRGMLNKIIGLLLLLSFLFFSFMTFITIMSFLAD